MVFRVEMASWVARDDGGLKWEDTLSKRIYAGIKSAPHSVEPQRF